MDQIVSPSPVERAATPIIAPTNGTGRPASFDFEDFFENGAIALHLVGGDGTILHANKAELDLLGYEADEYVGRNITEFHVDRPVIDDILARLTRGEKIENIRRGCARAPAASSMSKSPRACSSRAVNSSTHAALPLM